ncbi:DNA cytosine methyltransferase [Massilimicrobiota timonensis]|uniref:Cytosine-specific methyltransferase n=1 Tax=Massilimicrobiota timonensis TaxID=1776392 RepID=A0A1Y4SN80_9FIRM|nr:DNA (cytosine-5-)-methyltransferase [Massilimicrobiota timonensis]OUQ31337.1 DNA (cytosine-5-)-methyltransferase [Massilimicrobiota timonensis]
MPCVAIDLFCGIGGLTKGLSLAGINVIAGFDNDESCRFAYEANNNAEFFCEDITNIKGQDIDALYPENCIKILVGCAPCQPFSRYSSRYRKEGHIDNKWTLLYSFERLIKETLPDIVSMENVPNLINENVFRDFINALRINNYYVDYQVVYCPDYGVPQSRKRLVLLASRMGEIHLIPPIYSKSDYLTVRDAIGHLQPIEAGEICDEDQLHRSSFLSEINLRRIQQSVPGGTWREWDDDLKLKCHKKNSGKTFPSVYGRMEWDKPSPTITTQFYGYGNGRFGHPEQNRAISLREGAILQSFPDDYIFMDDEHSVNKRELGTHIGNAVPVELGRAIGISIQQHLERMGEAINGR